MRQIRIFLRIVLSIALFSGIVIALFLVAKGVTPNPGHPWTDIGDGIWQATGTTALRTFVFPDTDAIILTSSSSVVLAQTTKTGNYTASANTDHVILADATGGALTITLPTAIGNNGTIFIVKKIDSALANQVTVNTTSGQTIDGLSSISLANKGESANIQSDGANWVVLTRRYYDISSYRAKGSALSQLYTSPNSGTALTTGAPPANTLFATPFKVTKVTTIDRMVFDVTTGVSSTNATIGIYSDNGNNYPSSLVVDAGSTSTGNGATLRNYNLASATTLDPGLYWLAYLSDGAPTLRAFSVASLSPILGYQSSSTIQNAMFGWKVAQAFGALPGAFPAGATAITAVPIPAVFVRVSQ